MQQIATTLVTFMANSLWIGVVLSIGAAIVFASFFLVGYAAQTLSPRSHFARYFNETDLFALWMVSMLCGIGCSVMMFLLAVTRFTSENPLVSGLFTTLSVAAIVSPLAVLLAIFHAHRHARRKRAKAAGHTKASTPAKTKAKVQPAKRPKNITSSARNKTKPEKAKAAGRYKK